MAEVVPPKQFTLVCVSKVDRAALGCVIMTVCVAAHLLASVTVTVYVPADRPVAIALLPPDGDHE